MGNLRDLKFGMSSSQTQYKDCKTFKRNQVYIAITACKFCGLTKESNKERFTKQLPEFMK